MHGCRRCLGKELLLPSMALIDNRIKVIHKPNGGLSSARNAGIDIASGQYIGFVDSDDSIEPYMYENLLGLIKHDGTKLAVCAVNYIYEDGKKRQIKAALGKNCTFDFYHAMVEMKHIDFLIWGHGVSSIIKVYLIIFVSQLES